MPDRKAARRNRRVKVATDALIPHVPGLERKTARRQFEKEATSLMKNLERLLTIDVSGHKLSQRRVRARDRVKLTAAQREEDLYATMVASGISHNLFQIGWRQVATPWGIILTLVGAAGLAGFGTLATAQWIELEVEAAREGRKRTPAKGMRPLLEMLDALTPGDLKQFTLEE